MGRWPTKKKEEPAQPPQEMDANVPDEEYQPQTSPVRTPQQTKTLRSSPRSFYDAKEHCINCGRECLMKIPIGMPKYSYILGDIPTCKLCQCPIINVQQDEPEPPVQQEEIDYE